MWSVERISESLWNIYKDKVLRGTASILDDAEFFGNINMDGDDPVMVVPLVEELISDAIAEEEMLMSN